MFMVQISIPIFLAHLGLFILFQDDVNFQDRLFEIGERQSDKSQIRDRLLEIGESDKSAYGEFRYRQLLLASLASLLPFIALLLMILSLLQAIGLSLFLGIGTYYIYDHHLTQVVKRHREAIEAEFPAIIEMLTLAIAAGESPISAFSRIADRSGSKLALQFKSVVVKVKSGRPFHEALDELGRSIKSPTIRRFVDALVMAMERGAPIVDVLHRHVAEARTNQRNLVMDKAGKAETTMMIPIVFLILPISVLFALWPSINQLSLFTA